MVGTKTGYGILLPMNLAMCDASLAFLERLDACARPTTSTTTSPTTTVPKQDLCAACGSSSTVDVQLFEDCHAQIRVCSAQHFKTMHKTVRATLKAVLTRDMLPHIQHIQRKSAAEKVLDAVSGKQALAVAPSCVPKNKYPQTVLHAALMIHCVCLMGVAKGSPKSAVLDVLERTAWNKDSILFTEMPEWTKEYVRERGEDGIRELCFALIL